MKYLPILATILTACTLLGLVSAVPITYAAAPPSTLLSHVVLASKPLSGNNPPDFTTWNFNAWGQLDYYTPWGTFDYAFDAHGLTASTLYSLIYYPDPWPGNGLICIFDKVSSDGSGNLESHASPGANIGALPIPADKNAVLGTSTYPGATGAKIWLILSADVDCTNHLMTAWHPTAYLFELWLIQYNLPTAPRTCLLRVFWNLNTQALDHVTVCWMPTA